VSPAARKAVSAYVFEAGHSALADACEPLGLSAERLHGAWTVTDQAGGRWWPAPAGEELVAELPEADRPEASIMICASTVLLGGEWVA